MHDHEADTREWDRFYAAEGDAPHWSGLPNPSLVTEVSDLPPARALDVGCGEGADAIWLASRGWRVTAIDPSRVALRRAQAAGRAADVDVRWLHAGLLDLRDHDESYDLVSAQYPVLRHRSDDTTITALLSAVAPGGRLLFVHHELNETHATEHGFDIAAHLMPHDVEAHLDHEWEVERFETRTHPRHPGAASGQDVRDVVLRARRHHEVTTSHDDPSWPDPSAGIEIT